jgi:hypothetical protein
VEVPIRFQRKALEARQCVIRLDSLQAVPEKVMRVKLKIQWRSQEARDDGNMNIYQEKPRAVSKVIPGERSCVPHIARP